MTAYIDVSGVHYSYPGPGGLALEGVDLAIDEGEFACILGPSGCGKSTLLTILSGLIAPEQGRVTVKGEEIAFGTQDADSHRGRCGYVFQDDRLLPWRSVRQNITLALKAAGISKDEWEDRVKEYLSIMRISEFADSWPMNLSGGQRQRAAIARALAIDPAFVLMDEPFSTLDEVTARFLRRELLDIWSRTKSTIVFVTHSIREAVYLGDKVYLMTKGPARIFDCQVIRVDRPRLYEDPHLTEVEAEITRIVLERWGYHDPQLEEAGPIPEVMTE